VTQCLFAEQSTLPPELEQVHLNSAELDESTVGVLVLFTQRSEVGAMQYRSLEAEPQEGEEQDMGAVHTVL